ncbi:MAG: polyribonucleotide nucleotidyltransferase [Phycisphaeraceae bacterium]|nr:polyribonucleotide nucleotidyltransferase [Phycisphaerae bacterium]MBX3393196.1 polyribonucleotide nucleotidyltransferase [Phycisphaeraceae bacterium]HRJ49607.1 polyribonucleotide nucleotidyltransferase [Phycisphaerales bacterium]
MSTFQSSLPHVHRVEREIGGRTLILETGIVARQAGAAVIATYGGTTVLATALRAAPREGIDFFPLTVDYREKTSAAGKFPGGFRKREGAPNEKEILTMRMIDRPIRPLFPDGFLDEVQIQCFVMSHDGENDSDVLSGTAASAALALSDIPFEGPIATVRVGRIHTDAGPQYVLNPTISQLDYSDLDLVLSGHADGMNMIEVGAAEVDEQGVMGAIEFGYSQIQQILSLIGELTDRAGRPKVAGTLHLPPADIVEKVRVLAEAPMTEARRIPGKQARNEAVDALKKRILDEHFQVNESGTYGEYARSAKARSHAKEALKRLEEKVTRRLIVESKVRADGRGPRQIRPITGTVGVFARTHGSAFFQRGETQSLVSVTLGTGKDEQIVDGLIPEYSKKFVLHYNFPPFSTGEVKRITGPGRREIGHGALAERSLLGVLPSPDQFPYTIRVVSDITESNGSSSMASVCGGCLALMDAGVPIRATVAGISVGRFSDDNDQNEVFVTDIIGEEDFFGDMDFKVSGTREGITGIQLDLKARGLSLDQIGRVFAQAREGRLEIIDTMESIIAAPRAEISPLAPRLVTIQIDPEKIGKLIGPGGKMIRGLQDKWGVTIDVEDDGSVMLAASNGDALRGAQQEIEAMCAEIKVGSVYTGKVVSVKDFGAFVELAPGTDGMCHISELADGYVKSVSDVVRIGDVVKVKVILVDDQGRIKLSRKAAMADDKKAEEAKNPVPSA